MKNKLSVSNLKRLENSHASTLFRCSKWPDTIVVSGLKGLNVG